MTGKCGFADQAATARKRRIKTLNKIDKIIDWRPIKRYLEENLDRCFNAAGNPSYPALGMFKALFLQSWYSLSDRELSDNLEDRISFSHFCIFSVVKKCGLDKVAPVFADKGYSGKEYHQKMKREGYFDGTMYEAARNHHLSKPQRLVNRAVSRFQGKVERTFGTLKEDHRMARARYLVAAKIDRSDSWMPCFQSQEGHANGNGIGDKCAKGA